MSSSKLTAGRHSFSTAAFPLPAGTGRRAHLLLCLAPPRLLCLLTPSLPFSHPHPPSLPSRSSTRSLALSLLSLSLSPSLPLSLSLSLSLSLFLAECRQLGRSESSIMPAAAGCGLRFRISERPCVPVWRLKPGPPLHRHRTQAGSLTLEPESPSRSLSTRTESDAGTVRPGPPVKAAGSCRPTAIRIVPCRPARDWRRLSQAEASQASWRRLSH